MGPKNRNEPRGRFSSLSPARARRTALATALRAVPWPTTRLPNTSSIRKSLSFSPSNIRLVGMPVQRSTTSAICSGNTASETKALPSRDSDAANLRSSSGTIPYESSPARLRLPSRLTCSSSARAFSSCSFRSRAFSSWSRSACHLADIAEERSVKTVNSFSKSANRSWLGRSLSRRNASTSICFCKISRSSASSSSGLLSTSMRKRLAASSIRSIALSGKKRSVI